MKKFGIIMILFLILGFSVNYAGATSQVPGEYAIDEKADNALTAQEAQIWYSTNAYVDQDLCQKFTTAKSVIADYLYANVAGGTTTGTQLKIRSNVDNLPGPGSIAIYDAPEVFANPGSHNLSRFSGNGFTQVTPGAYYWLCISAPAGTDVWWYASPTSSYDYGFLQHGVGGSQGNQDFGFQIWSSNMQDPEVVTPDSDPDPVVPPTVSTPAASTPLPTGVSVGSGAAPVAPTAAIKAPTEVTIADIPEDQGGSLKLDWKASATSDVTGYKVFRSTTEVTKDFKEIVKTIKSVLTYTDNTAVTGQKYYYMVRAYKTTQESASSNVVNSISVDNLAPAAPRGLKMVASDTGINFSWEANTETDLAGYSLSVISSDDDATVIDKMEIEKPAMTYSLLLSEHAKVIAGADYLYYLQAKDANGNLSERIIFPAEAATATAAPVAANTDNSPATDWILIASIIIFVLMAGGITFFEIKAKKSATKVSPKILWPIVGVMVIAAGAIAWRLMPASTGTEAKKDEAAAVVAPRHTDWSLFTSKKYGFKLYHPTTYVVTEGAGGDVSVNKGADIIADIYSVDSSGDDAGTVKAYGAMYLDALKGYMTAGVESSATAAGQSAKKYSGTFGKNAGSKVMVHEGVKGSVTIFAKNGRTWLADSYDNADPTALQIFDDMMADMEI